MRNNRLLIASFALTIVAALATQDVLAQGQGGGGGTGTVPTGPGKVLFGPNSTLTDVQKARIIEAHNELIKRVESAQLFLRFYAREILRGRSSWYNNNFGGFYKKNGNPLSGTGALNSEVTLVQGDPFATGRRSGRNRIVFARGEEPRNLEIVKVGEPIFVGDRIHTVASIQLGTRTERRTFTEIDNRGRQRRRTVSFPVDVVRSITFDPVEDGQQRLNITGGELHRVLNNTQFVNEDHYKAVVSTFQFIADALKNDLTFSNNLQGNRTAIDELLATNNRGRDEFGLSRSGSALQQKRLLDVANDKTDTLQPLAWSEDRGLDENGDPIPFERDNFLEDVFRIAKIGNDVFVGNAFFKDDRLQGNQTDSDVSDQRVANGSLMRQLLAAIGVDAPDMFFAVLEKLGAKGLSEFGDATNPFPRRTDVGSLSGALARNVAVSQGGLPDQPNIGMTPGKFAIVNPLAQFIVVPVQ